MAANILQILILGLIQGAAELLPVSSSAHVIVVEKLMGLDASSPEMTFLLVMLHTGTMFAVIVYFWNAWRISYFSSAEVFWKTVKYVVVATVLTAIVGLSSSSTHRKSFPERKSKHRRRKLIFSASAHRRGAACRRLVDHRIRPP